MKKHSGSAGIRGSKDTGSLLGGPIFEEYVYCDPLLSGNYRTEVETACPATREGDTFPQGNGRSGTGIDATKNSRCPLCISL